MDLFDHAMKERMKDEAPLASRMRPRTLDEYIGQEHMLGPGKLLRRAIEADRLFASIILWGPPGTGKTTLAARKRSSCAVIANHTKSQAMRSIAPRRSRLSPVLWDRWRAIP